jgi:tetratricopeptide (TPR) repeat protein
MSFTTADISVIISLCAFLVSGYGIIERGNAAKRAERLQLTDTVKDMINVRRQLVELVSEGITSGNAVEILSAQLEVLSQQALKLVKKHELEVTSTECREIAMSLEQAGFKENADDMWNLAQEYSPAEGGTQDLYASRGYAYFLFRNGHEDEARRLLREVLSLRPNENDSDRLARAQTLSSWLVWEIETQGPETPAVANLSSQIDELINTCTTARGRSMIARFAFRETPSSSQSADQENQPQ